LAVQPSFEPLAPAAPRSTCSLAVGPVRWGLLTTKGMMMNDVLESEAERKPCYDDAEIFDELCESVRAFPDAATVTDRDIGFLTEYVELVAAKAAQIINPFKKHRGGELVNYFASDLSERLCFLLKDYK
jgi:hypothetical protein